MRLDWLYQGPNAGFVVAKDKGFYDEAGLNVDIGPGRGSGSTAQLVASKAAQFGFADGFVVGAASPRAWTSSRWCDLSAQPDGRHRAGGVRHQVHRGLEGKTIGIAPGGTQFQQWPAMLKGCKLDSSKIRVTNVDPAGACLHW